MSEVQTGNLTKKDIIDIMVDEHNFNRKDASSLVETFFSEIETAISNGESLKLSNFGNFTINSKSERPGRNPKTGEEVSITPRRVVTFAASDNLKSDVQEAHEKR
ncbi:integration host factor subunit alpha [Vibrio splendidus]|nr:integration host factor subunit alpha [Vibrio splendidus]MCC4883135.1 integration host factor subunit alpha [Vibrio splendidus]